MVSTSLRLGAFCALAFCLATPLWADVSITSPTGGNNLSADKALNSTNGATFTALGNLVIAEGVNTDFANGNNVTLVLTIADGWRFNPGVGTVSFTSGRNISAASLTVSASTVTATFTVSGTPSLDTLTIAGLQVQAFDGANVPGDGYIRRLFENAGTAVIAGVQDDFTTFGLLNQVPGAARALVMDTQPPANASAGALFSPQPKVKVVDQFGSLRDLDNTTVVTAARAAGSGTLQGTLTRTAVFGVASYTNLSHNVADTITIQFTAAGLASVTSAPIVVGPALADRLVFVTQPSSASAGVPFGIQPVLKTQDRFGSFSSAGLPASKLVTLTLTSGSGTLSGIETLDIGTAAGNGTVSFTDLQIDAAGTGKQLTATSSGLSNTLSATFAVSAAFFSKLQLLVPGESAAPGTPTGKTGTPNPQAAGTPFNVTVNSVDANWNLVDTISDTVGLSSSSGSATLPPNAALVAGTKTFSVTLNTVGNATLTASDLTSPAKTENTSPAILVGGGTPRKLTLQTQPSASATAGVPFAQQPVIRVEDAGGNLVATDNGRVITVARATGTATLQGTLTATTVNGLATFTNLSYNLAETITLNFTATGLTNVTSGNVVVGSGPFSKLQLLVPGELAAPGTASGKTGTPSGQTVGNSFSVTVNAVDAQWNLLNTVNDTVGLSSSDITATLPPAATLVGGTTNLAVSFNAVGNFTLTAADLTDGSKTASSSPSIAVGPAQFTPATGGEAISADSATGAFTSLTGPNYSENASGNVGIGTIILNAPAGFIFDTGGTAPNVLITRLTGSGGGGNNINGASSGTAVAMSSVTSTQLVFTVTSSSASGVTCKLTWQNVRVRPTAGTPLASGQLTRSGTSSVVGMSAGAKLGALREVPGAASKLAIQIQPSSSAVAGAAFAQQPVIRLQDQFGNFCTNNSSAVVSAARNAGSGTLQGTTSRTAVNGLVTFTNLSHNVATNITVAFTASGMSSTNSATISISPATADRLAFVTQPGSTTYGSALSPQPVLKSRDAFGNDSAVGLGASKMVSLTVSSGTGSLLGTTSQDIGTGAGNGMVSFAGLQVSMAGTGKQLSATASGLSGALSSSFDVAKALVTGSITANNKIYDGTTAASIATRTLSGALAGDDVSLSGGTASFANKNVGTAKTVSATGLTLSGASAGNYQLASSSTTTTANITTRSLTVSATGVNKVYDGTTSATVTLSDNRLAGDSLSSSYSSASFASKNVGTAKPVNVSGISITGTDAANYSANSTVSTTANITTASLTPVVSANNKVYDGTTNATIATRSLNGLFGSDDVSLSGGSASFANKSVGTNKTVTATGLNLSGTDAGNYQLGSSSATTTANITTRSLSVTANGVNKVYNGNTLATVTLSDDRLAGDSLAASYISASFANKNVGTAKSVSVSGISITGTDAANYSANTTATATADISTRSLVVTATGVNKVYNGFTHANVTLSDDRVVGDSLFTTYSSASFADKNVGSAIPISVSGISVTGIDAANYIANTTASASANISAKGLTVSGLAAFDKVYDATTSASLNTASAALTSVISGDTVTLNSTGATSAFADKNAGTGKVVNVSGLSLSGTDAGNYTLTQPTATASILKAGLTVTADDKSRAAGQPNPTLTATYSGFIGGETLATSGVTGSPALSTTSTNVVGTYPITAALGTLSAANYSFSFVNGTLTVTAGAAGRLIVQTQPSSSAVAGVLFAQQPQIRIEDQYGNLRSSDNSTVVTAARSAGSGALQGNLSATAVNGVATFANLSHNVANTINLSFSSTGLTNAISANIVVSPAAFTQLQLLVPGETTAPGSASGKTGTPNTQVVGTAFGVTVNAVDPFWNLTTNVTDIVVLTSTDATATLPPNSILAGTTNLMVTFNAIGSFTLMANDLTDGSKMASTSPAITVSPAQYLPAIGGAAISADSVGGAFTALSGPSYSENASGNVGTGTIILNAPAGFIFDTGGTAPNVLITRLTGSGGGGNNINGVSSGTAVAMGSVTSTQLVFTVTSSSASGITCKLTWQNVRVRPTTGTPLASGNLTRTGTSSVVGMPAGAKLGALGEVPGVASKLAIQLQPSSTAVAGAAFVQQPVIRLQDQFGNLCTNNSSTVVSAARNAGSGTLQGTTSRTAVNGLVTFTNLSHNVATNITLAFTASGMSSTNSATITISPAAADRLVFVTQPGSTTYGSALSPQPALKARDQFGNDSTVGLGASKIVSLAVSLGTGSLLGTTSLDIGTGAGNGMVSFSSLQLSAAGTGKQLSATASGLTSALSSSFDVAKATVTGSITANNKIYDGTTAASIATRALSGALAGDDVSLSGGSASFASKSAGTAKTVTATGLALSGTDAGNYQLASSSATTTASITTRSLSVTATGVNKTYDGTTSATVTLADNRLAGDALSTSYVTASFADKNLGTAKPVTVSGISISGTDAANYSANSTASTTANITARSLNVTATGANKVYDGTTSATVTLSDNRVAGDNLTTSYASASFATKSVATNKTVSVSGITVTGTDAANYAVNSTASTTANITVRSLSVTATGMNKVYDGTTSATVTLADNRLAGDSLSVNYTSASFTNKNVGTARSISVSGISLSGADAANYTPNTTASTSADITARALMVSATGVNKVYDGTTAATVTLSDNRIAGDTLNAAYISASFVDKNVGSAKPINVSGISLSGSDAGNYSPNTAASTTANITAASVTALVSVDNKVYNGTTAATIATRSLNGVLGSDNVSLSGGTATFASKTVGIAKTVNVSGLSLSGTDAGNYQLASTSVTTTADITARALSVSATGANKVYDGTTSATITLADNRIPGDSLTTSYTSASFANKNVGTAKTINIIGISIAGTDALNYTANSTATAAADITARSLSVSATGVNKVYDGTTSATVNLTDNRLAGDSLSTSYTSASFANKNVGTAKTVSVSGIALSGTDAANYSPNTTASATANISAKGLTLTGVAAADKVYDATTSATLNTASAGLLGVINGDAVTLNAAGATGAFADKNAGTGKVVNVSGLSLSGTDAGNYTLTQSTATSSITKAGLTVTADDKTRAAGAPNPTLTASYSGFVGGETLATSGITGSPALSTTSTNIAGTYPITIAQGTLSAANYSFSFVNGVLTVTAATAGKLVILTQPSSSAVAGVPFAQQPQIRIEDQYGNLRSSDNSTVVTATRNAGSGTLQGSLSAMAVNGVATFANLSHNVANTINLSFSSSGLTNATSANTVVSPAAFTQLQLLVPGETTAPGTASGKTGTPNAQFMGLGFVVTVNAVDAYWNLVNTVSDIVGLSSSDPSATLPAPATLAAGTTNLMVYFNGNGNFTLTATDLSNGSKSPSTSPAISVSGAQFTAATGGGAIPADGAANGTFTTLTGPSYSENASGNVGTGTIIVKAPTGFVFDTGGTAPTVRLTSTGSASKNINGASSGTSLAMTSVSATQLTFTVTSSSAGALCTLTWQNVRVRPTAGTPLASGFLRMSGTASVVGLSTNANLGTLREVAGVASRLVIQTQPSTIATAGVAFAQQPVLQVQDQFGNLRNAANGTPDNTTLVTAARNAGGGTLQGTLTARSTDSVVTFTNLSHNVATNITISFTSGSLTPTTSIAIAVSPAVADRLVFTTQPGSGAAGALLATQPVIRSRDQFGNDSAVGLGASKNVTVNLSAGTGPLLGTTTMDLGASAGKGVVAFTNLGVDSAGTNKQLTASAAGLTPVVSSVFSVARNSQTITFGALANKTYGNSPFAVGATASSGLPVSFSIVSGPAMIAGDIVTITGAGTVTVRASQSGDNYWAAASPVDQSFTVAKAILTITAQDKSRVYGTANPLLTASYNGFVNGESAGVLSGSPSLSTTATIGSPVSGSPYPITVAQGTLSTANYNFNFVAGTLTVTPAILSVMANDASRPYGQANPAFGGTLNGVRNGDNITATYTSSATTSSPAGVYTITPTLSDPTSKLSNYTVSAANGTLTITKVPLTITVNNKSRVYGAPNPMLTATYSGFVNGDDASVLSGSPALSTTATPSSPVSGSPYAITAAPGTLYTVSYNFVFVPAELSITPASSANTVSSSSNPSPTGSNLTFIATLSPLAPSAGIPSGVVQFFADGSPLGSPVTLSGGLASMTISTLPHGIHSIAAEYAGDGNFFGSTNSMGSAQVVNSLALVTLATYTRAINAWVQIPVADLMADHTSDADGDALTLVSVDSGTNGATVLIFGDSIYYLPSDSNPNRNTTDHLEFAVTDGFPGGTVTNYIRISLNGPSASPATIWGLTVGASGATLTFTGSPNYTYRVERTAAFEAGNTVWQDAGSATTDGSGRGEFTDINPPAARGFYRLVAP